MADKNWQAGSDGAKPASAAVWAFVTILPFGTASGAPLNFAPPDFIGGADPIMLWEMLIGGLVVVSFLAAILLWSTSALRKVKRAELRRNALVSTALNNLGQGIVMVNADRKVVFCNDRYLEIYGLTRSDIRKGMTGLELAALREQRGVLGSSVDDFYAKTSARGGHIFELSGDRSIMVKRQQLPNGGSVTTHEDCTEERRLARQLASTKNFLESVIDNVPVCIAAKSIVDGRYIFANRAFERFSRFSRDRIVGRRADELFSPQTAAVITVADNAVIVAPDGQFSSQFAVERAGEARVITSNRVLVRNERNEPEFLVALFDDVTERSSLSDQLETAKKFLELVVDTFRFR